MSMKRSDLVTIIAVITILLLLGLIAMKKMQRSRERSLRISCVSNLHHVNLSFRIWANDHDNLYPTQLADEKGGAKQSIEQLQPS